MARAIHPARDRATNVRIGLNAHDRRPPPFLYTEKSAAQSSSRQKTTGRGWQRCARKSHPQPLTYKSRNCPGAVWVGAER